MSSGEYKYNVDAEPATPESGADPITPEVAAILDEIDGRLDEIDVTMHKKGRHTQHVTNCPLCEQDDSR